MLVITRFCTRKHDLEGNGLYMIFIKQKPCYLYGWPSSTMKEQPNCLFGWSSTSMKEQPYCQHEGIAIPVYMGGLGPIFFY